MTTRLPEELNPYSEQKNPFYVLGVPPTATARELHAAHVERLADIDFGKWDDATRIAKREEVNQAYNVLRDVRSRVGVLLFLLDERIGREEVRQMAEKHRNLTFDFGRILRCSDSVFPHKPEPLPASGKSLTMKCCVQYTIDPASFASDHRAEALASLTLER
jgi:hypothetical protein